MENKFCHDCGVELGKFHKPNCDWEECPFCGGQLLSCCCAYDLLEIDGDEDMTDEQIDEFEDMLEEKGKIPFGEEKRFDKYL